MTKFIDALEAFNTVAGLEANQTPHVHLWQIMVSALEYAKLHGVDFEETLEEARQFHRDGA